MAESQNTIEDRVREQRMVGPTADQTNLAAGSIRIELEEDELSKESLNDTTQKGQPSSAAH
jgi:hypothetical protein